MANQHFAKIADVWKHLPLVEVLTIERPTVYAESHAGSAQYPLTRSAERDYGVFWFLDHADESSATAGSSYRAVLSKLTTHGRYPSIYPGSAELAMMVLGTGATYILCDTDSGSAASLREGAMHAGLLERTRIVQDDGRTVVWNEAESSPELHDWAVHIDPFDAFGLGMRGGPSAVDLARRLGQKGALVAYWYGYSEPDRARWAWGEIASPIRRDVSSVWCGHVTFAEPESDSAILGCGVLLINAGQKSLDRCEELGRGLERIYQDAALPSGHRGSISFEALR